MPLILAQADPAPNAARAQEASRAIIDELQSLVTTYGLKVVGAIIFVAVAWFLAGWATRLTRRALDRAKIDLTLSKFIANTIRWVVLVLAGIACLGIFGIQTASFAAVLGAAGFAVGLAFQGTLSNLAAGAMLLIFRPFKIGDFVVIAGQTGIVDGIELFTTKLDTLDNRRIILPNSAVFGAVIENRSHHPDRRLLMDVAVVYTAPADKVQHALLRAAHAIPQRMTDRPVETELLRLGPTGVEWQVKVWVPTPQARAASNDLAIAIKRELESERIDAPYPPHVRGA